MAPDGMIPYAEWDPAFSHEQANALGWRIEYILKKKVFRTRGAMVFAQSKPTWLKVRDTPKLRTSGDVALDLLFRKRSRVTTGKLGTRLVPLYIEKGNPDIAWLYGEAKDYYVPIQASFLAVIVAIYGRSIYFSFRKATFGIWVRAESSNRRIMKNNIVGMVREYRVDKTKLPFRVPVGFGWF